MTTEPKTGEITITLTGLSESMHYRLDTYHYQAGVSPDSRLMFIETSGSVPNRSQVFTYHDANDSSLGTSGRAVRMSTSWIAESTSTILKLKPAPGFNRAVLNALIVFKQ
jgi:hypothetical protein